MGLQIHMQVKHRNADPFLRHHKKGDAAFDSPFPIAMKTNGASTLPEKRQKAEGFPFLVFLRVFFYLYFFLNYEAITAP